ncbi:MAG TPA: AI-2E family transporter [Thermoleophilia bacterium]|nr:AI-2E family transporter [Thermoleophilia bacterium]
MKAEGNGHDHLSLADVARRTLVIIVVVGGSLLLARLVYDLRTILVWLLIAVLLAVTIAPAVAWLELRRVPRWLGASLVTLVAAVAVGALVAAVAVPLVSQSRELLGNLPHIAHELFKPGGPLTFLDRRFHIERRIGVITPGRLFDLVAGPRSIVSLFTRTAEIVAAVVTIVTITVMLLVEGPRAWRAFLGSLGASRERLGDVADRMQRSVAGYVRGNLLVSLLASTGAFIAMTILRVPYALPLALAVGLLDLIPLVGAILGATLCAFVALSVGWPAAVILIVYFVVYQQLENHFLAPVIYSRTVAMSPLTVLLVSLAGAVLGGLVGVLIAIPLASAGAIAVGELLRSKGVEGLADLAEVITEDAPEEGPVPLSKDEEDVRDESAHKPRRDDGDTPRGVARWQ